MTKEAGVAYKSIKYGVCSLKAACTNLAKEFTTAVTKAGVQPRERISWNSAGASRQCCMLI